MAFSCQFVYGTPDSWLQKSSLPAQERIGAIAFSLGGFGYVGTGVDSSGNLLNDLWKYDPSNDSWSQAATFTGSARKNAVAFVTDTFAYVGTGYDAAGLKKDFYRYDAGNNSWQQVEDLDSAGAVYPRRDAAAFASGDKGYVIGGYDGTTFYSKETWEYDAARDTAWMEKTSFPLAGRRWATAFSIDGSGFVGMGYNYSQEYFSDFWKYDVTTNAWTQVADYQGNKRGYASSFVINDYAFVGTGFDGALKGDFYMYDYANNSWSAIAAFGGMPTSGSAGFSVNGKGYVFGGVDTLGFKSELWEYTPDNSLGIENAFAKANIEIQVSPNPASEVIRVQNAGFDIVKWNQLKLFDASGKMVLRKKLTCAQEPVFVKDLPRGLYYYAIDTRDVGSPLVTGKVILQ